MTRPQFIHKIITLLILLCLSKKENHSDACLSLGSCSEFIRQPPSRQTCFSLPTLHTRFSASGLADVNIYCGERSD